MRAGLLVAHALIVARAVTYNIAELPALNIASLANNRAGDSPPDRRLQGSLQAVSDSSTLRINFNDGTSTVFSHSDALFGDPPMGGSIVAQLYYVNSSLPGLPGNASLGCSAESFSGAPSGAVFLVSRGGCPFTTKVGLAQAQGAAGVVVMDTNGICGVDDDICSASACRGCPWGVQIVAQCSCALGYMSGTDDSLHIPSMMISRAASIVLLAKLASGVAGMAYMSWDLPETNGAVEVQFWTHSEDANAAAYRSALAPYMPFLLGAGPTASSTNFPAGVVPRMVFEPHMYIWDGAALGCGTVFNCGTQCVNGQLYCSMDPDGDVNAGISGGDVVNENLRQLCLWQHLIGKALPSYPASASPSATPSPGATATPLPAAVASATLSWMAYADLFMQNCNTPALFNTRMCAEAQMQLINMAAANLLPSPSASASPQTTFTAASPSPSPVPGDGVINPWLLGSGIPLMSIDPAAVRMCMEVSNSTVNATAGIFINILLQQELALRSDMAITSLPSLLVNDVLLRGTVNVPNLLTAVCAGFGHFAPPLVCQCASAPPSQLRACMVAAAGGSGGGGGGGTGSGGDGGSSDGMPGWAVALAVCIAIGLPATIATVCIMQRRSAARMQAMLDDYRALAGELAEAENAELITGGGTGGAAGRPGARGVARGLAARLHQLAKVATTTPPPTGDAMSVASGSSSASASASGSASSEADAAPINPRGMSMGGHNGAAATTLHAGGHGGERLC